LSKKIAVIGIGNSLRGDDGIGVIVLESLLHDYRREGPDYLNFGTASFDLIHRLQNYETVLLIDAITAGLPPGELRIFKLEAVSFVKEHRMVSSHELNLKDIFELSRSLRLKTKIYVAGIQVQDVCFSESLGDPLKVNLDRIVRKIDEFIGKMIRKKAA
jgi:hydrogenase maturation protease